MEIELPIGMGETHKKSLFEFRYVIEAAGGVAVEEGGVSRRHTEMHPVFLHNFKSLIDPDNGRPTVGDRVKLAPGLTSKGALKPGGIGEILQDDRDHLPYKIGGTGTAFSWYKVTDVVLVEPRPPPVNLSERPDPHVPPGDAFRTLFRREWSVLCDGRLDPAAFLRNFQGLAAGIPDRARSDAEVLFDEVLAEFAATGKQPPAVPMLALLGCIGVFGLSSSAREWVPGTMGGGYYRAGTVPAPRPWCLAVAQVRRFSVFFVCVFVSFCSIVLVVWTGLRRPWLPSLRYEGDLRCQREEAHRRRVGRGGRTMRLRWQLRVAAYHAAAGQEWRRP